MRCDREPTGVSATDHWLSFTVPPGLMPDPKFDGRPAKIQVHRVQPVYAHGKCPRVPNRAAVLVHGSGVSGTPSFDLRHSDPDGGTLSTQRALAQAGIDTFAPSLLGYGLSTRFADGLDDPGNASLRPYSADGSCPHPEGCDRPGTPPAPLDQQGMLLLNNPLDGQRRAHSTFTRFARADVFVRDIGQVIDDAIARAKPRGGKVTLIGWSFGAAYVGRTLYAANPVIPGSADVIKKVDRAVFQSSPFGTPTEEVTPPGGFPTFPTRLTQEENILSGPTLPPGRDAVCTGHRIPGTQEQLWQQMMEEDPLGSTWGGSDPAHPAGVSRAPTLNLYGWNATVAAQQSTPALVIHGLDDTVAAPSGSTVLYNSLTVRNKVLVQVECGSHLLHLGGCTGPRCTPESGTPYGGRPGRPWAGPHATYQAAVIEWIKAGTFDGAVNGHFVVDANGVANPAGT
ncbi:alpha/beta fold hydrolase [Streptomyces sp. ISL-36]|uniref:alpha/beta fold hydrolase n=1 Tax=Streptomyces sp. ISL-36 TaxID=2819182 RepID=UPI001BE720DE|nr:alpha/beta fold hydrolase [Streptomyces sp. ISL-36]MBT2440150.1 alpha/beta fold hydrolase [Streptomyces sp. ISL-36]